jgi:hypothetical protein
VIHLIHATQSIARAIVVYAALALCGCSADVPLNPSFPLTSQAARTALEEMAKEPKAIQRPVVVLAGLWDPGLATDHIVDELRKVVDPATVIVEVTFVGAGDFDACRDRVLDAVNEAAPSSELGWTQPVDVVAVSMGGLVARYAAGPRPDGGQRLQIARLFTISTPHRGAALAWAHLGDSRIVAMNSGSAFLEELDGELPECDFTLVPYVRLGDSVVGARNAAPDGQTAWWVQNPPFDMSHARAAHDDRILADIARRLRGEHPFTTEPAAALPGGNDGS